MSNEQDPPGPGGGGLQMRLAIAEGEAAAASRLGLARASARAEAAQILAARECPADLIEWGERHNIPTFARLTWMAGFLAGMTVRALDRIEGRENGHDARPAAIEPEQSMTESLTHDRGMTRSALALTSLANEMAGIEISLRQEAGVFSQAGAISGALNRGAAAVRRAREAIAEMQRAAASR